MTRNDILKIIKDNKIDIILVDYPLSGDSGIPIISCYFNKSLEKWIVEKPIEKSNKTNKREFIKEEDVWEYILNILKLN